MPGVDPALAGEALYQRPLLVTLPLRLIYLETADPPRDLVLCPRGPSSES